MNENALIALRAAAALIALAQSPAFARMKLTAEALVKDLKTGLPKKADGTPWTDSDIHAAAEEARKGFQAVIDRAAADAKNAGPSAKA